MQILCCDVAASQKAPERKNENVSGLARLGLARLLFLSSGVTGRAGDLGPNSVQAVADLLPHGDSSKALESKSSFPVMTDVFCSSGLSLVGGP